MDTSQPSTPSTAVALATSTVISHPRGLYVCFFTEMWERFSFYGLKALLIFYLTEHFLFSDTAATDIFGSYFTLVYALPVLGGLLADRYLGHKQAVLFGGILLCVGHFGMAFEGHQSFVDASGQLVVDHLALQTFYLSLAFIIVGVGFLKPNISSLVGSLYSRDDPRRDSGFTLFYMGINLGSAASALVCGYIGQTWGWAYGFGLAGIGMLLGLLVFVAGRQHLPDTLPDMEGAGRGRRRLGLIYCGALVLVMVIWWVVQHHGVVGALLGMTGAAVAAALLWFCLAHDNKVEREQLLAAISLILFSIIFFLCFQQSGSSMNLFADRLVDREIAGWTIPASMFQSLNAIFIILLAPVLARLWLALARRGWEPSTPVKFALAIIQVGLGFAVMVAGMMLADGGKVAMVWLVLAYLLFTTGELCLSPIGLSMVTKLSIPRMVGVMMGVWFLGSAAAEYLAALIARLTSQAPDVLGQDAQPYIDTYGGIAWMALVTGALVLAATPRIKAWMHSVH